MLKIDNNLLQDIGLGDLPEVEKNGLLKHVYETLEMRVGMRLADQMTNEQLDEFERYFEAKDDAGAFKWLETNFPNYKDIVQEEFEKLKAEVAQAAPQIMAASQQALSPQAPVPEGSPDPVPGTALPNTAPAPDQPYATPPQPLPLPPQPPMESYQPQYPQQQPQPPAGPGSS